ncbi:MAG: hypothetical protein WC943_10755 [Elusimicrobiota bacterium]|jgi:hypothetical protein
MTAATAGYDVASVVPPDYDGLAGFLAGFGGPSSWGNREFWLSRFRLWWDENPAFRPEAPRGWMLRKRGTLVGFLAHAPSLMWAQGKPLQVFSVSTWMVLPEHRAASLDLLFRQMEASRATLLFDATPTELVAAILENLGFERLPWGPERESVALLDPRACLKARLRWPWVPEACWKAGGGLLGCLQSRRLGGGPCGPALAEGLASGLAAGPEKEAGPEFDAFWERTKGLHRLTNLRTSAVLAWHCFADTRVEKRLFACRDKDGVAGWLIMKAVQRAGLKTLELADLWLDPAKPGVFKALLRSVLSFGVEAGFELAVFGHFSPAVSGLLAEAGLFEVPLKSRRNLCLAGPGSPVSAGEAGAYFTALQGDWGTSP